MATRSGKIKATESGDGFNVTVHDCASCDCSLSSTIFVVLMCKLHMLCVTCYQAKWMTTRPTRCPYCHDRTGSKSVTEAMSDVSLFHRTVSEGTELRTSIHEGKVLRADDRSLRSKEGKMLKVDDRAVTPNKGGVKELSLSNGFTQAVTTTLKHEGLRLFSSHVNNIIGVTGDKCSLISFVDMFGDFVSQCNVPLENIDWIQSVLHVIEDVYAVIIRLKDGPLDLYLCYIHPLTGLFTLSRRIDTPKPAVMFDHGADYIGLLAWNGAPSKRMEIYNRAGFGLVKTVNISYANGNTIDDITCTSRGYIVSSYTNGEVYEFDKIGRLLSTFGNKPNKEYQNRPGVLHKPRAVIIENDGDWVYVACQDKTVHKYRLHDKTWDIAGKTGDWVWDARKFGETFVTLYEDRVTIHTINR